MDNHTKKVIASAQKTEITEHVIYQKLARSAKQPSNRDILLEISRDELRHYKMWRSHTKKDLRPKWLMVWFFYFVSRIFGLSFGLKLMEHGENVANAAYNAISEEYPEAIEIAHEEDEHEKQLLQMINEERLDYVGSMIRGLNDALVELTGALAGFTLALQDSRLVAMVGLITGIAASLSMGCTEYLAIKSEKTRSPLKSAMYTGSAYVLTVVFLILPYLLIPNVFIALAVMIINALLVIIVFNFYIAVATDESFVKRFMEMALLSLGVAVVSFGIGYIIREVLGVDI
ncbi:MAG: VIT1/CCC1 transporter family protein [Dehalococcoidales bacterium]|nr:VIT1/CCC1 transporter family protein [Dehalococcoidales bacterium]